jgi:folate-dependent tRNA-U54 methylase TrmFO/GidA|tara:strand:- start:599 stop:823 length:225 start_codon:yes stop_codon:yes gene_type:complete
MREKGLVDLRDMDKHFFEDRMEKECNDYIRDEADSAEYKKRLEETGDAGRAAAETFSIDKLKSRGLLDDGIRGE